MVLMIKAQSPGVQNRGEPVVSSGVPVETQEPCTKFYGSVRVSPTEYIKDRPKPKRRGK
jgi:hypothetical protein